ncbi:hypothetical protein [Streptomyces cucumeris]|uniref:hypothetical protein n=1 Tax=Streptomyces cucumeris TaxID=2962890 RepID=UPI0020C85DB0|nr:hypothetical protein [Streptomyces sp. NEAU-Y11]MCP9213181.1 hypothetical protein [Streptomyces sp. NEAU-Y11]
MDPWLPLLMALPLLPRPSRSSPLRLSLPMLLLRLLLSLPMPPARLPPPRPLRSPRVPSRHRSPLRRHLK